MYLTCQLILIAGVVSLLGQGANKGLKRMEVCFWELPEVPGHYPA